ncbi:hypothetical protein F2Q68_00004090 [Brassica cretica]|uniref:Armadillo repeat-containing domain-containing protein n=1 Tax=Brassica cretica TaxID=69181 RepID=A0A8S9JCY2_BRACR|nr:hypothetical protein F2Q68_00004090 [Brassica cretica]
MAIPVVPYTMVKLSRAVSKKQRTIRCQCLECDSSGKFKRSLFKKVHIAQRGAITPLIKMLESSDEQVVEMSAFALGRLAQDTHNQAGIGQRGGIISLLNLLDVNTGSENLADFIKAGGIQRLQDDNFTVQPTRDCLVRTLKRLDNKIHGPHERADILLETFNRIEKLLPVHQRTQLLPHPPTATGVSG